MSTKTLLALVGPSQDGDLTAGLAAARSIDAHLSLLLLGVAPSPPIGEIGAAAALSSLWLETRESEEKELHARVDAIEKQLASEGTRGDVSAAYLESGLVPDEIGRRGRCADAVLVGADMRADPVLATTVLEAALFETGAPVLLAPAGHSLDLDCRRIVLAWNSSPESAAAMRAAVNLLPSVKEIRVAIVDPTASENQAGEEPGADVAAFLARKGYSVTVDRLSGMGRSPEASLTRHAGDVAADMLVMGAYGHSRLRQRIFGGVTRSMLDAPPMPLLLAR